MLRYVKKARNPVNLASWDLSQKNTPKKHLNIFMELILTHQKLNWTMPRNKEMRLFLERGRGIQQAAQLTNLPMPKKKESKGLLYKRSKMETKPLLKRRRENSKNS